MVHGSMEGEGRRHGAMGVWNGQKATLFFFFLSILEWVLPFPSRKVVFLSCDLGFANPPAFGQCHFGSFFCSLCRIKQ
jgi:hypothetical protein